MSRCLYFIARNVSFPNSLSNSSPRQMIRSSFNPSYLKICIAILAKWISFIYPFAYSGVAQPLVVRWPSIIAIIRIIAFFSLIKPRFKGWKSLGAQIGGTRYRFAIIISSPPVLICHFRDHATRTAHTTVCVCVCVVYATTFLLSLFLLSFFSLPPFFFTSFIESRGNSNEWKVLKRAGSGISSLCCCAILHLSIMAMRCRFHHSVGWKKAAQTAYRPATFYLHHPPAGATSFPHQPSIRADPFQC